MARKHCQIGAMGSVPEREVNLAVGGVDADDFPDLNDPPIGVEIQPANASSARTKPLGLVGLS